MTVLHLPRAAARAALVVAVVAVGLSACASGDSDTAARDPEQAPGLRYVVFGASWPNGAHCGGCETFVGHYATYVEDATGLPVVLDDRTTNGGDTQTFLDTLQNDEAARESVANADIVVVNGGINDLDRTGALDQVAAGRCGGDGTRCLRAMARQWRVAYDAILDEVDELTADRDVAVRLVGEQNVFLSDPSIIDDYGLPADFARTGGELLTRGMADAMADVARAHGAEFVDVWRLFNGPAHDRVWNENSPEAHRAVARAILDVGLEPLDVG